MPFSGSIITARRKPGRSTWGRSPLRKTAARAGRRRRLPGPGRIHSTGSQINRRPGKLFSERLLKTVIETFPEELTTARPDLPRAAGPGPGPPTWAGSTPAAARAGRRRRAAGAGSAPAAWATAARAGRREPGRLLCRDNVKPGHGAGIHQESYIQSPYSPPSHAFCGGLLGDGGGGG